MPSLSAMTILPAGKVGTCPENLRIIEQMRKTCEAPYCKVYFFILMDFDKNDKPH